MGFIINLEGPLAREGKVMFDETDLSTGIRKIEIIADPAKTTYAVLTISIDKLNGKEIMGCQNVQKIAKHADGSWEVEKAEVLGD